MALLLLLNLAVWAVLDTLHSEVGSRLMLDGLYGWAFYLLIALFACALVARAQARETDTRALLIPALAVSPYVLIAFWLLSDVPQVGDRPSLELAAATVYLALLSMRVLQAAYQPVHARAVVTALVLVVAAPWGWQALDLDTRLWLTDDSDQAQSEETGAAEPLLYDQPERIAASVARMAARQPGQANVFFLGFAGDGEQGVFRREALFAQQAFADHYGSGDHSLELINDENDRDSYPIASLSGLQQALKLVAARMNVDEDVLVLFLTSHGTQDGLEVVNGSLPLQQLDPPDLEDVLEESGIKWRVVIVSACYAGVFVDALKADTTLVITAADATHSSFGCDDDRDLTYFGEAFLQDSLPGSHSLEEAFRKAADLIQRRETAEHKTHSNPQISVGTRIRERLATIEGTGRAGRHATIVAR